MRRFYITPKSIYFTVALAQVTLFAHQMPEIQQQQQKTTENTNIRRRSKCTFFCVDLNASSRHNDI